MNLAESNQSQLEGVFRSVIRRAGEIAGQIESGQAQTPLKDHFQELETMVGAAPQTVIVVGLDQEARGAVLHWLSGKDYHLLSLSVSQVTGMVEIQLRERGFVLQKADGTRCEFDRLDPFVQAIKEADLIRQGDAKSWVDPLKLEMTGPEGVQGLTLVMPESLEALAKNPAAFTRAMTQSNWLVVAGMADSTPGDEGLVVLNDWVRSVDVVWPVIFERSSESESPDSPSGWWEQSLLTDGQLNLPPSRLSVDSPTAGEESVPAPLKSAIFLRYMSRRLESAINMLSDRQGRREKEMRQKQAEATRGQKRLEDERRKGDVLARELMEEFRTRLDDFTGLLSRELKEDNKRAFLPKGIFTDRANAMLETLDEQKLEERESKTTHKLGPSPEFIEELHAGIRDCLREDLRRTAANLRNKVEGFSNEISNRLVEYHGHPVAFELDEFDERAVWADMREYVEVSPKCEIDLPKRGAFEALMAGRTAVFPVIMIVGMLGGAISAFADLRKSLGFVVGFLLLWIAGSYFFKKKSRLQDEERKHTELERMSNGLKGDALRIMEIAEREKLEAAGVYLADLKKETLKSLRVRVDEAVKAMQGRVERETQQFRGVMASVQKRSSDVSVTSKQIGQLTQEYRKFDAECRKLLRESSREMKALR